MNLTSERGIHAASLTLRQRTLKRHKCRAPGSGAQSASKMSGRSLLGPAHEPVAAGILPAVEPWLPARRKPCGHWRRAGISTRRVLAARCRQLRQAGCPPLRFRGALRETMFRRILSLPGKAALTSVTLLLVLFRAAFRISLRRALTTTSCLNRCRLTTVHWRRFRCFS